MKKKQWSIFLVLVGLFWLIPAHFTANGETVDGYQANVEMAKDGSLKLTEKVTYTIDEEVDQLTHRIVMNDSQEATDVSVAMQAAGQQDAFPFAQSTNTAVGTFNTTQQGRDYLITLYNTMANETQTVTYQTNWLAAWVKYDDKAILEYPFFSLPYDLREAQITFHFPGDIDVNPEDYLIEGLAHYQAEWKDDQTLQVTAYDVKADQNGELMIVAPTSLIPDSRTEGPKSKGEQIAQHIADVNQETADQKQWQITVSRIIFWVVTAIVGLYTILLWHRKLQHRPANDAFNQWQYQQDVQTPAILPYISRRKYSEPSLFWLLLFQLVAEENIVMRFEYDAAGNISDAYFRVRNRNTHTAPELSVLRYIDRFEGAQEVSYRQMVYGSRTAEKTQKAFRRLMTTIKRQLKQQLQEQQVYDRSGNRIYAALWWLVMVIVVVGLVSAFILTTTAGQGVWQPLVLVLWLLLMIVWKMFLFPIYTANGIQLKRHFQQYLAQLPTKQQSIKGWAMDYVYSWATNTNRKQYAMMDKLGIVAHHPTISMFEPIHNKQLKELNQKK